MTHRKIKDDIETGVAFVLREHLSSRLRAKSELTFRLLAKPASKVEEINFTLHYTPLQLSELHNAFPDDPSFGRKYVLQEYCRGFGVGVA